MDREKLKVSDSVGQSTSRVSHPTEEVTSDKLCNMTSSDSSSKSDVISLDQSFTQLLNASFN